MLSKVRAVVTRPQQLKSLVGKPQDESLPPDVVFDILKNQRRRATLAYLRDRDTTSQVTVKDLATTVAAHEQGCQPEALTSAQRKRVYVALKQSHLPRLADAGFIDYDAGRGQVTLRDQAAICEAYLEILTGRAFPWSEYYVGLGAVSSALIASLWIGAVPFALVPNLVWATVITAVFTLSAIVHMVVQRRQRLLDTTTT